MPKRQPTADELAKLDPEARRVTQDKETEYPGTGKYDQHWEKGGYNCIVCGQPLFESSAKFDAHCGWPSFSAPKNQAAIEIKEDTSYGMVRAEVICGNCGAHLGHLFPDGPLPTGDRYCLNSAALHFTETK